MSASLFVVIGSACKYTRVPIALSIHFRTVSHTHTRTRIGKCVFFPLYPFQLEIVVRRSEREREQERGIEEKRRKERER